MASTASAALFVLFKPTSASSGDLVTVRLGGTAASFTLEERQKPFKKAIRLYLAPSGAAGDVRSRLDNRLHFIGSIVPDRNGRGILTFKVPPVETGAYVVAAWCPGCATFSFGRTFFVQTVPEISRYRQLMTLRIETRSATEMCPVTLPGDSGPPPGLAPSPRWHGNGFLWTSLQPDGVFTPAPGNAGWPGDPEGSIGTKLFWFAAHVDGSFVLKGQRVDDPATPPLVVHKVNRGSMTGFRGSGTWATPVTFPSAGCWKLTARVRDISLSFVLRVNSA